MAGSFLTFSLLLSRNCTPTDCLRTIVAFIETTSQSSISGVRAQ